jgi:glucose dehydrogenase
MTLRWTLVGVSIVLATAFVTAQQGARGGDWTRYGGDAGATKYASLDQINKDNISQLRVAWRRQAVDASVSTKVRPLVFEQLPRNTPDDWRCSIQPERHRVS